jgi:hypothetical protein
MEIDFLKRCQLEFGSYVQTHEKHTNSMTSRTVGAIALRPTGNEQGGYYSYSLNTGRRLNRNRWTALPMPDEVMRHVHAMARRSAASRGLTFANRDGAPDDEESDDEDNTDSDNDSEDDDYDSDNDNDNNHHFIAGVNEHNQLAVDNNSDDNNDDDDDNDHDNDAADTNIIVDDDTYMQHLTS